MILIYLNRKAAHRNQKKFPQLRKMVGGCVMKTNFLKPSEIYLEEQVINGFRTLSHAF